QQGNAIHDLRIARVFGPAATSGNGARGIESVSGIADSERSSNGGGLLRFNFCAPRFNGGADGTTARSLRAKKLHVFAFYEAEFNELFKGFVNLRNQRTASHGNDNVVRQTPAKLLGD